MMDKELIFMRILPVFIDDKGGWRNVTPKWEFHAGKPKGIRTYV